MNIRKAVMEDAREIARVHVDSWRTTYKNIMPDEYLMKLSYEQRTDLWSRNISREGNYVFVAEDNTGEIVGFADCGKREKNNVENFGDLTSIYILKEYQGCGIGKKLMKQVFLKFEELNVSHVFVEVLEDNETRFFYEYHGAKLHRSEKIIIGGKELNLLTYEWDDINSFF